MFGTLNNFQKGLNLCLTCILLYTLSEAATEWNKGEAQENKVFYTHRDSDIRRPQGESSARQWAQWSRWAGEGEKGRMDLRVSAFPEVLWEHKAKGEGGSHRPLWVPGGHSAGRRRKQLVAGPAFTLVHLAILVGRLHPVCEDVQAAGKYEVLKFTIETARFRVVFFLIFHFFVALRSI